uniref:AB hydrolase-1 domain-containing protein n=1 Tax=Timema shepardi TaxID=629360 RepID=A0A7R9B189_TIMSH|nr:unnamed protein product [Timema shepardi]
MRCFIIFQGHIHFSPGDLLWVRFVTHRKLKAVPGEIQYRVSTVSYLVGERSKQISALHLCLRDPKAVPVELTWNMVEQAMSALKPTTTSDGSTPDPLIQPPPVADHPLPAFQAPEPSKDSTPEVLCQVPSVMAPAHTLVRPATASPRVYAPTPPQAASTNSLPVAEPVELNTTSVLANYATKAGLKIAYRGCYVDIGSVVGSSDKVWTISMNTESKNTPILLLHGFASGVALWCLNLDSLAAQRPVYAIDILGEFIYSKSLWSSCSDSLEAESQLVRSVEEWRREMKLEKFILLGHSMGGFLAASYAIEHPDRPSNIKTPASVAYLTNALVMLSSTAEDGEIEVRISVGVAHLILADPWGFPERPADVAQKYNVPIWVRCVAFVVQPFNPLWPVRAAGPFGQWLIGKMRPDIVRKFSPVLDDAAEVIPQYLYQCNSQVPSGEAAFHAMMSGFGWAKNPMLKRMDTLRKTIPITLMYGTRSWVDSSASETIKAQRPDSYVNVQVINGAGHHVYADKSETFNRYVLDACEYTDKEEVVSLAPPQDIVIETQDPNAVKLNTTSALANYATEAGLQWVEYDIGEQEGKKDSEGLEGEQNGIKRGGGVVEEIEKSS